MWQQQKATAYHPALPTLATYSPPPKVTWPMPSSPWEAKLPAQFAACQTGNAEPPVQAHAVAQGLQEPGQWLCHSRSGAWPLRLEALPLKLSHTAALGSSATWKFSYDMMSS